MARTTTVVPTEHLIEIEMWLSDRYPKARYKIEAGDVHSIIEGSKALLTKIECFVDGLEVGVTHRLETITPREDLTEGYWPEDPAPGILHKPAKATVVVRFSLLQWITDKIADAWITTRNAQWI